MGGNVLLWDYQNDFRLQPSAASEVLSSLLCGGNSGTGLSVPRLNGGSYISKATWVWKVEGRARLPPAAVTAQTWAGANSCSTPKQHQKENLTTHILPGSYLSFRDELDDCLFLQVTHATVPAEFIRTAFILLALDQLLAECRMRRGWQPEDKVWIMVTIEVPCIFHMNVKRNKLSEVFCDYWLQSHIQTLSIMRCYLTDESSGSALSNPEAELPLLPLPQLSFRTGGDEHWILVYQGLMKNLDGIGRTIKS